MSERERMAPTRQEFLHHGFREASGSLLRYFGREFVIDALPGLAPGAYTRVELRGGSDANRIPLRVESTADLDALMRMVEAGRTL